MVDGPAAGHAVTFLMSATGLADAVRGGPIRSQADDVLELLADPERCMAVLVTLPETTPVNETIETAYALEDDVGIRLGPIVVNGVDQGTRRSRRRTTSTRRWIAPTSTMPRSIEVLRDAATFRRSRRAMEREALDRLAARLPLGQVQFRASARRRARRGRHRHAGRRVDRGVGLDDGRRPRARRLDARRRGDLGRDRVLRVGWCRQDDDRGGHRDGRRPVRVVGWSW